MKSIWDNTLKEFRDALASGAPTPGGGSAAMVAAALGASLVSMAVEVSVKKDPHDPRLDALVPRLRELIGEFSQLADRDIEAFSAYMADPREETARAAGAVPEEGIQKILDGLGVALEAAPLVNKGIVSDVSSGASLLLAGLEAAVATAKTGSADHAGLNEKSARAATLKAAVEQALGAR